MTESLSSPLSAGAPTQGLRGRDNAADDGMHGKLRRGAVDGAAST
jgi:hypothetical protein